MSTVTDIASLPQPQITDELEPKSILFLAQVLSTGTHDGVKYEMVQAGYTFEFEATLPDGSGKIRERIHLGPLLNAWANQIIDRVKETRA